jgi:predicted amidohydrolase YtcJ
VTRAADDGGRGIILTDAVVVTMDPARQVAGAIGVRGPHIAAVGRPGDVQAALPGARVISLAGRTVVPGLIDAHAHLDSYWRNYPSLAECGSIDDIKDVVAERVRASSPGEFIILRELASPENRSPGNLREGRYPDRHDLDAVAPANPVWIRGSYVAPSIVNTRALELAGITSATPQPRRLAPVRDGRTHDVIPSTGGHIHKDEVTGEPTGLLYESDTLLSRAVTAPLAALSPEPTYDQRVRNILDGIAEFNALGITGMHEGHGVADPIDTSTRAYLDVWSQGKLSVRTHLVSNVYTDGTADDLTARLDALGHAAHRGVGDDWLRFCGISVTLDGPGGAGDSVQPKRAGWPGPHDSIRDGVQRIPAEKFRAVAEMAAARGIRMCTKAGGEAMIDLTVEVYRDLARRYDIAQRRWVMMHSQFLQPRHMAELGDLGVVTTTCANFIWNHGSLFRRAYGDDLAERAVPYRSMLEHGMVVANGSDTVPKSPFFSMWLMLTRTDGESGQPLGPSECVSRDDALRVYTSNGAYLLNMEDRIGSLEPGKYADLVVLSDDYLTVPVARIPQIKPVLTMVSGAIVHNTLAQHEDGGKK